MDLSQGLPAGPNDRRIVLMANDLRSYILFAFSTSWLSEVGSASGLPSYASVGVVNVLRRPPGCQARGA